MKCEVHFIFKTRAAATRVQKHVEVFTEFPLLFCYFNQNWKMPKNCIEFPPSSPPPQSRLVEVSSVAIVRITEFGLGHSKLARHIKLLYALTYGAKSLLRLGYCEYGYTQYTYRPTYCFEDIRYLEKAALRLHIASARRSSPNGIRYSSLQTCVPCNLPRTAVRSSDGLPSTGQWTGKYRK